MTRPCWSHHSIDEGFGGRAVRGIVEDKDGNVWFATSSGVTKYDRESFVNDTEEDGLDPLRGVTSLESRAVQCVFEGRDQRLWAGGYLGLYRLDGESFLSISKDGPW